MKVHIPLCALTLLTVAISAIDVSIRNQSVHLFSPSLYGIFFEEINFAGEGGLFAELIRNRDFEALGRGNLGIGSNPNLVKVPRLKGKAKAKAFKTMTPTVTTLVVEDPIYSSFAPWTSRNNVYLTTDNTTHPFAANPTTLRVQVEGSGQVINPGYWGINCVKDTTYILNFYAKTSIATVVEASLQNEQQISIAKANPISVSGDWKQYSAILTATDSDVQARFVLSFQGTVVVWLDSVSLRPSTAVAGIFREDLFARLKALNPAFVRFPGGNYLEGNEQATRWDWKTTLGPMEARPGHFNSAWGYWSSDGLGLYEYLLLCELLHAQPQMSIYTGYSMRTGYVPLNQSQPFAQDAVDALEFANGGSTTRYGSIRVAMGHPQPFGLNRLEVGNEESDMTSYASHYKLITSAIWAVDPSVQIVASGCWTGQNVGVCQPGNPCTSGQRCDAWDDHLYECPDTLAQVRSSQYDNYNRSSPKVFKGEFAANAPPWLKCQDVPPQGPALQNLQAALAEAAYMIGFERNADVVLTASFAPLFCSAAGTQWPYNLINFNTASSFGIPSYYVQSIFSQFLGHHTVALSVSGPIGDVQGWALASIAHDGSVFLKLLNYSPQPVPVTISFAGFDPVLSAVVSSIVLTGSDRRAVNSFESPLAVSPQPGPNPPLVSGRLSITLPAWSLSALSLR